MPSEFDAPIQKALDAYELMRRKAEAWDVLVGRPVDIEGVALQNARLLLALDQRITPSPQ